MLRSSSARPRAGILVLVLMSSVTLLASPRVAIAAPPAERYGVADSYLQAVEPVAQRAALGVLYGGGVRLVRADMSWDQVEPAEPGPDGVHDYKWAAKDKWIGTLAQAGMRVYPIIDYSTPWASVSGEWNSVLGTPQSSRASQLPS